MNHRNLYGMILAVCLICCGSLLAQEKSLAESLGYGAQDRVLIINADDFGMCHAENLGTYKVLEEGVVTSTTMMMTCPWVPEAIGYVKEKQMSNVGVHVALTSEWKRYRWGPVSRSFEERRGCSLMDKEGYLWPESPEVELYTELEDVQQEVRAQIQSAMDQGVNLSHFDSHMGSLYGIYTGRVELLAVALSYSYEFGLPYRVPYVEELKPFRQMGFAILDQLTFGDDPPSEPAARKAHYLKMFQNLPPGVTELYIHPALYTDELKHITNAAQARQSDVDVFTDPEIKEAIKKHNIILINFEPLKKWQREQLKWRPGLKADEVFAKYRRILEEGRRSPVQWKHDLEAQWKSILAE